MIINLLKANKALFDGSVAYCDNQYHSGNPLVEYRKIINYHRDANNIHQLVHDNDFKQQIVDTLKAWHMNQRGAILEQFNVISESIEDCEEYIIELYDYKLSEMDISALYKIKDILFLLFRDLKVMKSKRRIVGNSKTMHFLLPNLVMPIDGNYTMPVIYGRNKLSTTISDEFDDLFYIMRVFHEISLTHKLKLSDYDTSRWNTSIPKIIDNAIIGLLNNDNYEELLSQH